MPPPTSPSFLVAHLFVPEIKSLLAEKNYKEIKSILITISLVDLADVWDEFSESERILIFRLLPEAEATTLFQELEPEDQTHLIGSMGANELEDLLDDFRPEEAVRLFHELPPKTVKHLTRLLEKDQQKSVQALMTYPDNSVGSWIHLQRVNLRPSMTATKALQLIRQSARLRATGPDGYYVTDTKKRAVGYVSLRALIAAPQTMKIKDIMRPVRLIRLDPFQDQEEAARLFSKYKLSTAPVVDQKDRFLGYLQSEDIIPLIEEEVTEDIAKMAGTQSEELESESVWRIARFRLPWLVATCLGGLAVSWIVKRFDFVLSEVIALAAFLPLIMAMGGNVGIQSSTILVRGLAIGEFDFEDRWKIFIRELGVGILLGLFYGLVVGLIAHLLYGPLYGPVFGTVVGLGMMISMIVAVITAVFGPLTLVHFGVDPATATGPLITTTTDLAAVLSYFSLALWLLM